ncbi:glycosyl hydrolase family 61-domain-containing protein [Trametes elegans]|nr:glycosyl hydrolase family 61-domain-containing protein [Trametes elegans]
MFSSFSLVMLAIALAGPAAVNAHGYVTGIQIGDKNYPGYAPFTDPYLDPVPTRIERQIPDDGPVTDFSSTDLICNKGGETPAAETATTAAGTSVTFIWTTWPGDHMGYVSSYMAECKPDCIKANINDLEWFKVDAEGYSNGKWASTKLIENGSKWTSTIPSELKAGNYLMRHEIIALHDANQPQMYPMCIQLKVTDGGNQEPSGDSLANFQKLYSSFKFPDIWQDNFTSAPIPGPRLAFVDSGSGSDNSGDANSSTPSSSFSTTAPTSSAASQASASPQALASSSAEESPAPSTSSAFSSASPLTTGRCSTKRRRNMVKRHASRHAKRHH